MTYASAFERDIFISYCHTDNENPLGLGWIEMFHKILLIRMNQILGARLPQEEPSIWRDARLQGNEAFANVLGDELRKVALVVSILSPSYVRSEWCAREVSAFCQAAQERGGLTVGNKTRIFKVLKTPVDRDQHPPALQSQIGYAFFTLDKDTKIPREFTLTPGDSNTAKALEVINDLAYDIKATLDAVNQALGTLQHGARLGVLPPPSPAPPAARRSVYLAETSFALDDERSQVRRDLEARGVRVLPEGDLPVRHPLQFRQAVNEALAQCDLSVHMVAPDRSLVLPGELHDTVYLQNQMAAERCTRSDLTRLIWIPEGLTPGEDDTLQRQFITMLHCDPEAQKNAEVLTNPVHALIARIHETLRKLDEPKKRPAPALSRSLIYLIAHTDDGPMAEPLRETLFDSGCEVRDALSDPNATEKEIFESHKMNLIDCDAAIVCFGKAGEFWMRSQQSDAQKAIGWREGKPMKARAIYLGPPDTPPKARLRTHDYLVLDGRAGFDAKILKPLLEALARRREVAADGHRGRQQPISRPAAVPGGRDASLFRPGRAADRAAAPAAPLALPGNRRHLRERQVVARARRIVAGPARRLHGGPEQQVARRRPAARHRRDRQSGTCTRCARRPSRRPRGRG